MSGFGSVRLYFKVFENFMSRLTTIIIIIVTHREFFTSALVDGLSLETAEFLKSPGLFLVFWPILKQSE